jgi:hypothetical protein
MVREAYRAALCMCSPGHLAIEGLEVYNKHVSAFCYYSAQLVRQCYAALLN